MLCFATDTHAPASRRLRFLRSGIARRLSWMSVVVLLWTGVAFGDAGAARINAYLSGLNSLKAEFEQFTFNAGHTQLLSARGTFYLLRPGRFRWEYITPNKQVIIADGKRVYLHDLDLKQVSHQSQDKALRGTPALLLANREPIENYFETRMLKSADGRDWIELIPKQKDTDVVRIELGFGNENGKDTLDSLIMQDSFGQETRLNFTAAQHNITLKPDLFKVDESAVDDVFQID